MKLIPRHPWARPHKPHTVAEAVCYALASNSRRVDDAALDTANNACVLIARLIGLMHERGLVSNDEIELLLPMHKWSEDHEVG